MEKTSKLAPVLAFPRPVGSDWWFLSIGLYAVKVAIALLQLLDSEVYGSPSQSTLIKSADIYALLLCSIGLAAHSCQEQAICHRGSIKTELFLENNFFIKRKGRKSWEIRDRSAKREETADVVLFWPIPKPVFNLISSKDWPWSLSRHAVYQNLLIFRCSPPIPALEPAESAAAELPGARHHGREHGQRREIYVRGLFPSHPRIWLPSSGRKPPFCPSTPKLPSTGLSSILNPRSSRQSPQLLTKKSPGHEWFGKGITSSVRQ